MSYCKRLQLARILNRNFSSKFVNPSSKPLSKTHSRTISPSAIAQENPTKRFQFQKKGIRNMMVISCGIFGSLAYASWDTVPYSNRTCRVFFPRMLDKLFGDLLFDVLVMGKSPKGSPKSPISIIEGHPDIERLRAILTHIVEAAKAKHTGTSLFSWEVFVVDEKSSVVVDDGDGGVRKHLFANAFALPNGKIFISKQFLEDFTTDEELAAVIGHEVAHVVSRHIAEKFALRSFSWIPLQVVRLCITDQRVLELEKMEDIFFYYSRQREFEADYIGLMLMASAGYDPKSAPKFYLKTRRLYGDAWDFEWLISKSTHSHPTHTHPPSKDRAKKLIQVMEEASTIYHSCSEKKVSPQSRLWIFREIVTQFRKPERIFFFMVSVYSEIAEHFRQ